MYKDSSLPARILIVKMSSLGDVIQSFCVLEELHRRFPETLIDWVVEAPFHSVVEAHPLIHRSIPIHIKKNQSVWADFCALRKERYDLIFDLQGNCKSGLITFLARGKVKVGYGIKSAREWPNVLATDVRLNVSEKKNIREYYLQLIELYLGPQKERSPSKGVSFKVEPAVAKELKKKVDQLPGASRVMVCPGSKWANKQLDVNTWIGFLKKMEEVYQASFLFIWGDATEKKLCEKIQQEVRGVVVDKLPIPAWQNLMEGVDLVIAVDSSALHLCGTTSTPSFSIFGPTSKEIFKPLGERHMAIQGICPYGRVFNKQCPVLRNCPTGACIKNLTAQQLFEAFQSQYGSPPA